MTNIYIVSKLTTTHTIILGYIYLEVYKNTNYSTNLFEVKGTIYLMLYKNTKFNTIYLGCRMLQVSLFGIYAKMAPQEILFLNTS
jgi:hypothetical protein